MATSVLIDRDKYSELFLLATRRAGLVVPVAAFIYGLAIFADLVMRSPLYDFWTTLVLSVVFVVLGVVQYAQKPKADKVLGVYIGIYHLMGVLYLTLCTGTISPMALAWILMIIITDLFYGHRLAIASGLLYVSASLITYLNEPSLNAGLASTYLMFALMILTTGYLVAALRGVQRIEHSDLKRSQLQEQLQRNQLTALINSVGVAIMSISHNGTIRIYNAALLSLLDTNRSLGGQQLDDVLNLYDQKGSPVALLKQLKKSDHLIERDDLSHRFADGENIRLSVSCAPIRSQYSLKVQPHEGYIFIIRDITKAKSLEEERDEFISVVSHELRTPIAITEGTLSNLQFLLEREQDVKKLAPALKESHEQIIYLSNMVNDLSTLSRAERGAADKPEEIDVKVLLEELFQRYQEKAFHKKLQLNLDAGAHLGTISTSRLYLEEILQNFITNAIKYTEKGSITLRAKRTKNGIEFAVKDTGIGISKSDQKHVFEKFYRSEDYRTRETSGTGLGLYVVQKLAAKLHTHVEIESRLNHGSCFSFVLNDVQEGEKSS